MPLFALLAASLQQVSSAPILPPVGSPPLVRFVELAFPNQGNVSLIEPQTYLYYIRARPSRPSDRDWTPYDEQILLEDFRRLWATGFLDDLWIEVKDVPYDNGVVGKHVIFNIDERQRVKVVDYAGSKALEASKIDERLKDANASIRLDTFIDSGLVRKVEGIVRDMLREEGFQFAAVTHEIREIAGGPKLVHLTFRLDEGPNVRVRRVGFSGNHAVAAGALRGAMKDHKQRPWWRPPFLGGTSRYREARFDEDADRLLQYYRDHGYVTASIGTPELTEVRDSSDGRTRWVDVRIPVKEGKRYRLGAFDFDGNVKVPSAALRPWFKLKSKDYYSERSLRKGLDKARELYGAGGYFEFTGYPELEPVEADAVVNVTMRVLEGHQFFVNRLTFSGNTTTHDSVVRREVGLVEGGVFNTEALKYSVRRLNQLGYFKPIEDQKSVKVDKSPGLEDRVDITLKLEEQNRNQVTFGAGLSQYEGVFGNLSYTTANFLGRGESLTVSLQKGSRSNIYQIGFVEPYLFERPISGAIDLYSRKYDYYTTPRTVGYSEVREGTTVSAGRPLWRFARAYVNYTYEVIHVEIADSLLAATSTSTTAAAAGIPLFNPFLDRGRHVDSRVMPTVVYNTVDSPVMPHSGIRVSGSVQLASTKLRGSYDYLKPELELILYRPTSRRTGFGFRAEGGLLHTYSDTREVPYYLRYFLGGETQIRGTDIRTVGPFDEANRALGGNKFVLFNAEYFLDLFGPVRLLAFHDAGQAFDEQHPFNLRALRTSSGGELRVFIPMLNVPFRLIYYVNVYRDAFQPYRGFKFAVGTTF